MSLREVTSFYVACDCCGTWTDASKPTKAEALEYAAEWAAGATSHYCDECRERLGDFDESQGRPRL